MELWGYDFLNYDKNNELWKNDLNFLEKSKENFNFDKIFSDIENILSKKEKNNLNDEEIALINFFCNKKFKTTFKLTQNQLDDKTFNYLDFYKTWIIHKNKISEIVTQNNLDILKEFFDKIYYFDELKTYSNFIKEIFVKYLNLKFWLKVNNFNELDDDVEQYIQSLDLDFQEAYLHDYNIHDKLVPEKMITHNFPKNILAKEWNSGDFIIESAEWVGLFNRIKKVYFYYQIVRIQRNNKLAIIFQRWDTLEKQWFFLNSSNNTTVSYEFKYDDRKLKKSHIEKDIRYITKNKVDLVFKIK